MSSKLKINYGCGETKLEGFVNIDIEPTAKPDLICDLRKEPLPYEDESIEVIHMIHNLEHIELKWWPAFFFEFHRVLIADGRLILAYPEFEKCAKHFIENSKGMRDFFRWTLYGMQRWPGDYHVVPMVTSQVIDYLSRSGFHKIQAGPEPSEDYNTFVVAYKGPPPRTRETMLKEAFTDDLRRLKGQYSG